MVHHLRSYMYMYVHKPMVNFGGIQKMSQNIDGFLEDKMIPKAFKIYKTINKTHYRSSFFIYQNYKDGFKTVSVCYTNSMITNVQLCLWVTLRNQG